jgi:hypothetical protein
VTVYGLRVSAGAVGCVALLVAISIAVPIEAKRQRVAARAVGDVEIYRQPLGQLRQLLRQEPEIENMPFTRQSHLTYFSGKACASWLDGMVLAGLSGYAPYAPDDSVPVGLFVQEPFRGSIRGVHLGDGCFEAAKRLGIPDGIAHAEHESGLRDFPGMGISWLERSDHRITVLVVAN